MEIDKGTRCFELTVSKEVGYQSCCIEMLRWASLVFFNLLLDIPNFLSERLQSILVIGVLALKFCKLTLVMKMMLD